MPRKPRDPSLPKPPRQRKTKKQQAAEAAAKQAEAAAYEPLMTATNGLMLMDDAGMYTHDPYAAYYHHPGPAHPPPQPNHSAPPPQQAPQQAPHQVTHFDPPHFGNGVGTPLTSSAASTPTNIMRPPMQPQPPPGQAQQPSGLSGPLPAPSPVEFRIHDMNRRFYGFLRSGIAEKDYAQWWDAFSHEFFDDDAKMHFVLFDSKGSHLERYTIGRQLIPRYYRTLLDGGMYEMYYVIKGAARESSNDGILTYECNSFMQVSKHDSPYVSEVQTDCTLKCEWVPSDEMYNYRVKSWTLELQPSQEFQHKQETNEFVALNLPQTMPRRPIFHGMNEATLNCLKFSAILEPMQLIMSQCKPASPYPMSPQEALRRVCFARSQQQVAHAQQAQQIVMNSANPGSSMMPTPAPEEAKPKPARKRTRKTAATPKNSKKTNASPVQPVAPGGFATPSTLPGGPGGPSVNTMPYGMNVPDVLVVGEPSLLGGDYNPLQDERTIEKMENPHYDPNSAMHRPTPSNMPPTLHPSQQPQLLPAGGHHPLLAPPTSQTLAAMTHQQQQQHMAAISGMGPPTQTSMAMLQPMPNGMPMPGGPPTMTTLGAPPTMTNLGGGPPSMTALGGAPPPMQQLAGYDYSVWRPNPLIA